MDIFAPKFPWLHTLQLNYLKLNSDKYLKQL